MEHTPDYEDRIDYFVDGRRSTADDVKDAPFTVVCDETPLRCAVHTFRSRDSYLEFATKGRPARYLATSIGHEQLFKTIERTDEKAAPYPLRSQLIEDEIGRLAAGTGRPLGVDVWTEAARGTSILDGPLLGSIVLHENRNLSGRFVYIPHWWGTAYFSSNGMNDRASCITLAGSFATLWEHTWFSGRKIDILYPFWVGFPLWWVGWEDTASSAFAWGIW